MYQSLAQMTSLVKAKIDTADKQAETDATKKPTFFEQQLPRLRSGDAERDYQTAKLMGQMRAKNFIDAVRTPSHPDHEHSLSLFHSGFGSNMATVEQGFVDAACRELNSPDPEDLKRDIAYEQRLAQELKPNGGSMTHEDLAWYNHLLDCLQKSRDERGYGGKDKTYDKEIINSWKQKYYPHK
jgi:hypothetical protein